MTSRIPQHSRSELKFTLYVNGVATDADALPTIKITREDGTALVPAGTAITDAAGTGVYSYTLSPAQTAALDLLTIEWTATLSGVANQIFIEYAEIVGDFLFSIGYARKLKPLDSSSYTADQIAEARTFAEISLEDACGVAFVPRYARERFDGADRDVLLLRRRPLSITSVSVDGTALSAGELAELELYDNGRLYRPTSWPCGRQTIEVKYVHGYRSPPPRVARAARALARLYLVESPLDERTRRVSNEAGTIDFLTDAVFELPEANRVVEAYGVGNRGVMLV